jgi:hypothetical protein
LKPGPPEMSMRHISACNVQHAVVTNDHDDDKGPADPLAPPPDRRQLGSSIIRRFRNELIPCPDWTRTSHRSSPLGCMYDLSCGALPFLDIDVRGVYTHMEDPS